jgi:hypothetical protein
MASCNLKRYEHEDSPQDEIFRGARSYPEVLGQVRALSPDKMIEFYDFQRHRRSSLPKVLQGGAPMSPATQQTETRSQEAVSSSKQETWENLEKTEVSTQKEDTPVTDVSGDRAKDQAEILTKKGEDRPLSTPDKSTIDATGKQSSTEIGSPIQFIMPLQFTRGNPDAEVIFIEDLMPIPMEEIPPSDFFFSKKRKVVVKREMHQRAGATVKRHRVLIDGEALEEVEFAEEVAGSLGAYATTNQFSVGTLKERTEAKRPANKSITKPNKDCRRGCQK